MLKTAIATKSISLEDRFEFVLNNLNVYKDVRRVAHRERARYHERIMDEMFQGKERRKIHGVTCVKKEQNGDKKYYLLFTLDMPGNHSKVYLFSEESNAYKQISMEELAQMTDNGIKPLNNIPGLKRYKRRRKVMKAAEEK